MGLKLMKFHAILHLVQDMLLFGTPSEMDTGSNESHNKTSKCAAKLTQRKEATFNLQTAQRMTEFLVLDLDLAISEIESGRGLWEYFGKHLEAISEVDAAQYEFLTFEQVDDLDDWEDPDDPIPKFRNLALPNGDDTDSGTEASDANSEASPTDSEDSDDDLEARAT